ncbi:MAG: DUF2975 domain-containing protein [bacterium]
MYLLKENFIIKTVCAYVKLFKLLYPVYFILFVVFGIFNYFFTGPRYADVDFFRLFSNYLNVISEAKISILVFILILISNVIVFTAVYFALIKLFKFLLNVLNGNPYIQENGKHLKFIGVLIVCITIFITLKDAIMAREIPNIPALTNYLLKFALGLSVFFNPYFVLGLFIIVLGEVIVRGTVMKKELDLTV